MKYINRNKLIMILGLFFVMLLASCGDGNKGFKTLDGVYNITGFYYENTNSKDNQKNSLDDYLEYNLVIHEGKLKTKIKFATGALVEEVEDIIIKDDYFYVEGDYKTYYYDLARGVIELNYQGLSKYPPKIYFSKSDNPVNSKAYENKTFKVSSVSGYNIHGQVSLQYFESFEIEFYENNEVKFNLKNVDKTIRKTGNYFVYPKSILLDLAGHYEILTIVGDDLEYRYIDNEVLNTYYYEARLKTGVETGEVTSYSYSYDEDIHNELISKASFLFDNEANTLRLDTKYISPSYTYYESFYTYGERELHVNSSGDMYYLTEDGYVLFSYKDVYYASGATSVFPNYDIISGINNKYKFYVEGDDYYIRVNNKDFGSSQHMPPTFYYSDSSSSNISINIYLKISFNNNAMNVVIFDKSGNDFFHMDYYDNHDIDFDFPNFEQIFSGHIDSAIGSIKFGKEYVIEDRMFLRENNYLKLDLEAGYYIFSAQGTYSFHFLDEEGEFYPFSNLKTFGALDDAFGIELEEAKVLYVVLRPLTEFLGYTYKLDKYDSFDLEELELESTTYELDDVVFPNGYKINIVMDNDSIYRVKFIPREGEVAIIRYNNASMAYPQEFVHESITKAGESFNLEIYSNGTLIITELSRDEYTSSIDEPLKLEDHLDTIFAGSSIYDNHFFYYDHTGGNLKFDSTYGTIKVYNEDMEIIQNKNITEPGRYIVEVDFSSYHYVEYKVWFVITE